MNELVRFSKTAGLFLLPLFPILLFPLLVFYYAGEFRNEDDVVKLQAESKESILFGKAYITSGIHESFKLKSLLYRKPEVLVLGDSRVLQFRSQFFTPETSFYNGGGLVGGIRDFTWVLKQIPEDQTPKVIIIGLDQPFFSPYWDRNYYRPKEEDSSGSFLRETVFGWRNFYLALFRGEYPLRDIVKLPQNTASESTIGMTATLKGDGVVNDGSYVYGQYYKNPYSSSNSDYQFRDTLERIEEGTRLFERASTTDPIAVEDLENFLTEAARRNIYVVGFLPPYPHAVFEKLQSYDEGYEYMWKIKEQVEPLFIARKFSFFDFSDLATVGASDDEVIDGFHASERAYLRLMIVMATSDLVLQRYTDIPRLQERLNQESDNYQVFRNEF